MEEVELLINQERFVKYKNPFGEIGFDDLYPSKYLFERGNVFGIVSEHGGGGESISRLLSGEETLKDERIFIDNQEIKSIKDYGWYIGKTIYSKGLIKREKTVKEALQDAVNNNERFDNIDNVIELFHLDKNKMSYKVSNNCLWERWRSSLAIGYASNKKIFCFPWMNTADLYSCLYNSSVFRLFDLLKEDSIVIIPTSRKQNLKGIADKIITIDNPSYDRIIFESDYYQECLNMTDSE